MSFLDLLFAEALAAGLSRTSEATSGSREPPPENFFVLPPHPEAWKKLYTTCMEENLVLCVEVTKDPPHVPSINVHPHFLSLARKVPNIPFIQVKTGFLRTFDKVREDLGGVETAPTLVIAFFDVAGVRIKQVEGEDRIKLGIRLGIIEDTIKEFLDKRAKIKVAEKMSEHLTELLMGDLEKRKQRQEYEDRLKKEARDLEERLKESEQQRKEEEEKQKKMEEDKRKKVNDLLTMDLQAAKIFDIKTKMDDLKISHVGALTRDDLLQRIKKAIPSVSYSEPSHRGDLLLNYETRSRHTEDYALHPRNGSGSSDISQAEEDKIGHSPPPSDATSQEELLETRMLYACTLHDMDILGKVAMRDEGVVVRAKCTKPGIPNPKRVYAMKVIMNVHQTTTLSKVQTDFKNEYDILSSLPKHRNIVQLYAFFYDRPGAYRQLSYLKDGVALCLLMENLSQNMQDHIDVLKMGKGPKVNKFIHWLKDVVCGLLFLFQNHVVHRDMKLDNLLLASGDTVKISDFGMAIQLDSSMKLPFSFVVPRGGNEAHLSPEILNTRPKPGNFLNYSKQPVWEAGVLAYELAGHRSPFKQSSIDQRAYNASALPSLIATRSQSGGNYEPLPSSLTSLVHSMMEYSPDDRPSIDTVNKKLETMIT